MVEKTSKFIAQVFSAVFNPFLVSTFGFLVILYHLPGLQYYTPRVKMILVGIVFTTTCVLPLLFILLISFTAKMKPSLDQAKDRLLPYLFSAFSIFMGAQLLGKLPIPGIFRLFMLGIVLLLILLFVITLKWKISGHAAGIGGMLGTFLSLLFKYRMDLRWIIIATILLAGLVGTSRLILKKHTPAQVYAGFSLSLLVMYVTVYFF